MDTILRKHICTRGKDVNRQEYLLGAPDERNTGIFERYARRANLYATTTWIRKGESHLQAEQTHLWTQSVERQIRIGVGSDWRASIIYHIVMIIDARTFQMTLSQKQYAKQLLKRFGMAECKPVSTPMKPSLHLIKDGVSTTIQKPYCEVIRCLTYLMVTSRPDLIVPR